MRRESINLDGKEHVSTKRLSEVTGYSTWNLKKLATENAIPAFKRGRAWWFPLLDVQQVLFKANDAVVTPVQVKEPTATYADI
jgi:hypothetical protein